MSHATSISEFDNPPRAPTGISVLMTVFNAGVYLAPAIDSILNQTFQDIEFVIVNDGSTDGTAACLDSLTDPRVRVFHEPNRGTAGATNFGLPHCTKKYIARMDADDLSVPTRLAEQFLFMEQNPDVALVGTQVQVIGESESGMTIPLPTQHKEIYSSLIDLNHGICHGSCMFRNDLIQRIDGYWKVHRTYDDWDMFLRIAAHGKLANLKNVLYQYRFLATSLVGSRLREMRTYYRYAVECEKQRVADREIPNFDDFAFALKNKSMLARALDSMGLYAIDQYRVATSDLCRGKRIKGYARLAFAAICSPRRTWNRLSRMARFRREGPAV